MKIAINCIYFTPQGGGITEYIENLVKEITKINLDNQFIFYIIKEAADKFKEIVNEESCSVKIFPFSENQKYRRSLLQNSYWKREESIENFDIFHSPFFHSPKFKNAKVILTVHDLRFLSYPFSYKMMRLIYLKYVVKKSIKRADHLISISNFTKNEIVRYYDIELNKINVIHEAIDEIGFSLKNNTLNLNILNHVIKSNQFILAVGHLEPRKNYIRLIDAYNALPKEVQIKYKLIIVGKQNHDFNKIIESIKESMNVIYLNFVKREELIWLYANCKAHVFPSIYEGFGFPSLEAGIFGKPTVGANQSSIPEIAGDGGIYFDPFVVEDISLKILQLLNDQDLYQEISRNAILNTRRFSWRKNAIETMKVYNITIRK